MRNIFFQFLKENKKDICLYAGFIGIFAVIFELYRIRMDAVKYAFLLSFFWLLAYAAVDFIRYKRRHEELIMSERRAVEGFEDMPAPIGIMEEDYQRIIRELYKDKLEIESRSRISRQEMNDYYSMWVHQVKTPIAALRVLLQSHEQTESEEELALVREMKMELFKVEQYVEMVLTYLRMESMSSDLVFDLYPLDGLIRQAVKKYSQMFIMKKIKLNYVPLDKKVLTDEKWLVFVLEQLLSNALKYTKEGSISIYEEKGYLIIEDTGIGIYPEDLPRVFEKGFTGYNGRRDKKSTGIGLYLCKTVMDRLRHPLWIESEPDKGTKVYLDLERPELQME